MKLTANWVPTFFRPGFQTRAEQEGLTSYRQQGKGSKILVPSKISQHCPEKPGEKLYNLDRVELCCLRQFKEKSIPVLSKIQDGVILAPCSQPRRGSTRRSGHQPALVQWEQSQLPNVKFLPLPTRAWIPSGTLLPHPSGWDLLILNHLIWRMRSWAFCNSRERFYPCWDFRFILIINI